MKILFVIGSLHLGGAEKQMYILIRELVKNDVDCEVFALTAEGPLLELYKALNINVYGGDYISGPGKLWFLRQLLKSFTRLWQVLNRNNYNIVHTYLPLANFIGTISAKFSRIPLVVSSKRALGTHQDRFRLWKYFDVIANSLSDVVTVNSEGVKSDVIARENVNPKKLKLIYNGIDPQPYTSHGSNRRETRKFLGFEKNKIYIVIVANLIPYKGHADAIEALALLHKNYPDINMCFAGDDRGIQNELEMLAKSLGVSSQLIFLGSYQDIPALLGAADIGLISSHEEGFCNALLEQMAASLPIVATDVGGNSEALDNGKTGLLVRARQPSDIARAIQEYLENRVSAESMAKKARERVQKEFSIKKMVDLHMSLYRQIN